MIAENYGLGPHHSRKASNEDQKGHSKRGIGIMHQLDAAECVYMPNQQIESIENDLGFSSKSMGSGAHKESAYCYGNINNYSDDVLTEESDEQQNQVVTLSRVPQQHVRTQTVDSFGEIPLTGGFAGSQMHLLSEYLHGSSDQMNAEETRNFGRGFIHNSVISEKRTTLENQSDYSDEEPKPYAAPQQYQYADRKREFPASTPNLYESFHREDMQEEDAFQASQTGSQIDEKCELLVWGSNHKGQLGLGDRLIGEVFRFPINLQFSQDVFKISCGQDHTALITKSKMLFVMGNNMHGQLGIGSVKQREDQNWSSVRQYSQPALVDSIAHLQVIDVSCGDKHTVCVALESTLNQQSVYTWGDNSKGQLGITESSSNLPTKVNFSAGNLNQRRPYIQINKVSAGNEHTLFLDDQQSLVLACGESRFGQLGLGKQMQTVKTPFIIDVLSDKRIFDIAAGRNFTMALTREGYVYATGLNSSGQLGMGHQETLQMFMQVPKLRNIQQISASSYSGAIDQEGNLYVWGFWGTSHALTPRLLKPKRQTTFQKLSVGDGFGVALDKRGRVYGWGSNELGQLGTSYSQTSQNQSEITEVKIVSDKGQALDVVAGQNFVIAKMHEVQITLPSESQSLTHLSEARQKANFAKQLMQIGTQNQYQMTKTDSAVSPDFKQNEQMSCSFPNLNNSNYDRSSKQAKSFKTQQDFKDTRNEKSPKYMQHHPSITTTTSQQTQQAWNPSNIYEVDKISNTQHTRDIARFELSDFAADSRKFDLSNGFQMRNQDDNQEQTIQTDQKQTIKPYEQQEARIWDSFSQIIEEKKPDHYDQSLQQVQAYTHQASLKQIIGARSKSTQVTRVSEQVMQERQTQNSHPAHRQSTRDDYSSNFDSRQEKQEQKERKRKQKELQRKFKQMQAEYFENKARREKELQNVYMNSYQQLSLDQQNNNSTLCDISRIDQHNNSSIQAHRLEQIYQMPLSRPEEDDRRNIKIYLPQENLTNIRDMRIQPRSKSAPRPTMIHTPISRPPLHQLQPVQAVQPYCREPDKIFVVPHRVQHIITNTSVSLSDSAPNTSGRPTPQLWQRSPDDHRPVKKIYDQAYTQKLRKKFKRIKMDQRNKNVKMQEQASEIEHLRGIIDQLKSQISTRKHAWQKKLKEREDRHNQETRKIRAEISVLQEQVLTAERMCQHKDHEAKAATQKLKDVGSQVQYVEADLRNLRDQVKRLQGQNDQLKYANEGLVKKDFEKDAHMRELKQHMDVRNMCISEAESTIKEQTKALQKMEGFLHEAQSQVEVKDESVKSYARQIEQLLEEQGNLQRQIESLKGFINELEGTNLDLMRLVDASNQKVVEEYRSRASNILQGKRKEETVSNNSMLHMTIRTQNMTNHRPINSRSYSPMRSQEIDIHSRTTNYCMDNRRSAMNDPPNVLMASNFDTISGQVDDNPAPRMPLEETIKTNNNYQHQHKYQHVNQIYGKNDYQLDDKGFGQSNLTNPVKIETQQIVERAGKMLEKLFAMNKKLGTRALVPQIEAPQEVKIERPQPLTVQNQRSSDFSRNFAKQSELTSPNQYVAITDTRSKSQEDSFQNFQQTGSASQTSQVIGKGLQNTAQQIFRSEPEMIFPSHTPQSFNSDKLGIGIRFKTQGTQQSNSQERSQESANLNFRAINKRLMKQQMESVNRSSVNI